jgi:hypothetical protein
MKSLCGILLALVAQTTLAQMNPIVNEEPITISAHVWALMGFPNIAIIVGSRATLIVDTGMGPKNGAAIARVTAKLVPSDTKLFLTTTHFHPRACRG